MFSAAAQATVEPVLLAPPMAEPSSDFSPSDRAAPIDSSPVRCRSPLRPSSVPLTQARTATSPFGTHRFRRSLSSPLSLSGVKEMKEEELKRMEEKKNQKHGKEQRKEKGK